MSAVYTVLALAVLLLLAVVAGIVFWPLIELGVDWIDYSIDRRRRKL